MTDTTTTPTTEEYPARDALYDALLGQLAEVGLVYVEDDPTDNRYTRDRVVKVLKDGESIELRVSPRTHRYGYQPQPKEWHIALPGVHPPRRYSVRRDGTVDWNGVIKLTRELLELAARRTVNRAARRVLEHEAAQTRADIVRTFGLPPVALEDSSSAYNTHGEGLRVAQILDGDGHHTYRLSIEVRRLTESQLRGWLRLLHAQGLLDHHNQLVEPLVKEQAEKDARRAANEAHARRVKESTDQ